MVSPHSESRDKKDWKKVICMSKSNSSSKLQIQRGSKVLSEIRYDTHENAVMSPLELRQICKNKTASKKTVMPMKSESKKMITLHTNYENQRLSTPYERIRTENTKPV